MYDICVNTFEDDILRENSNIKISVTNDCTNNSEKNVRNQILKIQEVETVVNDNNAKGDSSTNILTKIYLIE